ncbi:UTRA domain-containing protein [Streptomyces cyaneofuscatus]|uniref:UTRA domain-containing protein n=1 Tax=Streptomyces cyaneofuscatus TaxID=66883 RepID=UPI002FF16F12
MDADVPGTVLKRERTRDAVLELIESRSPGDAIPSERALCSLLGVSRPTVRAAVDELVAAGLLVREHGRGMFVAPAKITQELVAGDRSLTVPQAAGAWSSRLLEFTTLQAGARVGRKLRMSPAAEIVYVARLRLVDGAPMAIEHLHIRAELVPGLSAQELESGDLYEHLRATHGVHVHEAVQAIEPTVVTRAEAKLLDVPELSPALLFERLTSDTSGRPVEYVHSLYRGDRYRIVSRLALGPAAEVAPDREGHHPGIPPGAIAHGAALTADVPLGRLTPAQWRLLTDTARRYGGELRLTPWRGVVILGPVPQPEAADALRTLSESGLITAPDSPWTGVGACIGHPGCAKSLSDVRAEAGAAVGPPGRLPVYWSGCERRCGHPHGEWIDVVVTPDGHRISHVRGERRDLPTTVRNDPARLAATVAEARA